MPQGSVARRRFDHQSFASSSAAAPRAALSSLTNSVRCTLARTLDMPVWYPADVRRCTHGTCAAPTSTAASGGIVVGPAGIWHASRAHLRTHVNKFGIRAPSCGSPVWLRPGAGYVELAAAASLCVPPGRGGQGRGRDSHSPQAVVSHKYTLSAAEGRNGQAGSGSPGAPTAPRNEPPAHACGRRVGRSRLEC